MKYKCEKCNWIGNEEEAGKKIIPQTEQDPEESYAICPVCKSYVEEYSRLYQLEVDFNSQVHAYTIEVESSEIDLDDPQELRSYLTNRFYEEFYITFKDENGKEIEE